MAYAVIISRGIKSLPMLKCSSERCVCAPQSLSAGTSPSPRLSVSLRISVILFLLRRGAEGDGINTRSTAPTWPVGTRCHGLRKMLLELLSSSSATATPRAQPPHPLPSRISDPPPLRPSRSRSHRPGSLVPSPASSLADRPHAVRSRASDGAPHISDRFLRPARIPAPLASLAA